MRKKVFVKMFSVRPQFFSSVKKFLRLLTLQNQVQATHLFLKGDDLGWGAPGLGGDLGWGGEATRDAQGCGGGPPPLGLLERDHERDIEQLQVCSLRCAHSTVCD